MTLISLLSCLSLCFLPHVVYYRATPLSEFRAIRTTIQGFVLNLLTSAGKMVLLACLLPGTEHTKGDLWQDLAQLIVTLLDVLGIYFALTRKWTHESISNEYKFQAVGIGWAFGDSSLRRLIPMWLTGFSPEFSSYSLIEAMRSNIVMVRSIAFAAVGMSVFNKRIRHGFLAALMKIFLLVLVLLPFVFNMIEQDKRLTGFAALGIEASITAMCALITRELNIHATKKTS